MSHERQRTSIAVTSLLALSAALSTPSFAQSAEAEQLFRDGVRLLMEGKAEEACLALEGSNRIEPRAGTLIRLGDCRLERGQLASAWSAYADALARVKDPRKRKLAQEGLAKVEGRLSKWTLTVPATALVAGLEITRNGKRVEPALWNREVPIDGGHYELSIKAEGYIAVQRSFDVPVDNGNVVIEVPALLLVPVPGPSLVAWHSPTISIKESLPAVPPALSQWSTMRRIALGTGALGCAALVTGIVFGLQVKAREAEAMDICPDPNHCANDLRANSIIKSAHQRAEMANIMFGAAAVAAVGGAVLWFLGAPKETHDVALVPTADAKQFGLSYFRHF